MVGELTEPDGFDFSKGTFSNVLSEPMAPSLSLVAEVVRSAKQIAMTPVTELDSALAPVPVNAEIRVVTSKLLPFESQDPSRPGMVHAIHASPDLLLVSQELWLKLMSLPSGDGGNQLRAAIAEAGVKL